MKTDLLEVVCCPACAGKLAIQSQNEMQGDDIWEGWLVCTACGQPLPIQRGMAYLYVDDEAWQPKAIEAEGWVTFHKDAQNYDPGEDAIDLQIPYYPQQPWTGVAKSFDIGLELLNLQGGERVLDLGAGRGWAAKHFALHGCRAVALDVRTDENVGLGRGKALMEDAGVFFERVIGDGENLPFFDDAFDIVFCAAALHHATNLPLFIKNVSKVLKPGGLLCAINEPCINIFTDADALLARNAAKELALGINETRPTLLDYRAAVEDAGLQLTAAFPPSTYPLNEADLRQWSSRQGAIRPALMPEANRKYARGWLRYLKSRTLGMAKGDWRAARAYSAETERAQIEADVLLWMGSEIVLLAQKPVV